MKKKRLIVVDKIQIVEEFFRNLEDTELVETMISDRIDKQVLEMMDKYALTISQVRHSIGLSEADLLSNTMIIGYLLKAHLDRSELEQRL